jgi:TIR domain-containing protein
MQNKDPNDYKANPDFLLATASHLGVTAVLSDQPSPIIKRVERVLQKIYAEIQAGRIEAPECLEGIGAQLAIVQGQPPTIEELLWAYSTGRALRNRGQTDEYSPIDTAQHSLLDECESINREVWNLCEERIERARRALGALDQSTIRVADMGGIVDRRALPQGHRIFISYAHEDKRIAQIIERRLLNGGVPTWRDARSLTGGSVLPAEIVKNIRNCSHFCVIISPDSSKSRWVAQETSWALTFEVEHGSPQIIPLLHNEKKPPENIADRFAISLNDWSSGISELWTAIGVPERANWSLSEVGKLLRTGKKLLKAVEWCGQANGWMTVHEETFEALEESEIYLTGLGLQRQGYNLVRFARTHEIHSKTTAYAAYSEEFYGFTNSYIGGTVLLGSMANLIEELLASIRPGEKKVDDHPT